MNGRKVLCIGLDAACHEQIDPLVESNVMPNLEGLLSEGVSGELTTTTPPWTPSAWPSITTGTAPWTHGIYDFYDHTSETPHLVSAEDLEVPYVWEYLDQAGEDSIVVNVPVTHPVHEMSGSIVPGYLAPEDADVLVGGEPVPQSSIDQNYRIYARKSENREAKIEEELALIDSRVAAARRLDDRHDWSFMMVQFQRTDSIFHTMGHDSDAVRSVYGHVDDAIGSLLDLVDDETTVLVVSDHGIHEYEQTFHCNTWLRDGGWLQTTADSERHSWGETTKPTSEKGEGSQGAARQLLSTGMAALQSIGITAQRAEKALSLVGLAEPVRRRLPDDVLIDAAEHVDWEESEAYCRSVSFLGIRCNVKGRDSDGVVEKADFAAVRSELIEQLEAVRAPDGAPVFETVYDRHDRHGSDVANEASAPDIVVRPHEMTWKVTDVVREPVFDTTDEFSHKYEGLFVAAGPTIDGSANIDIHALDVVPTILELLGYQSASVMEGEVPANLIKIDAETLESIPEPSERTYLAGESSDSSEVVTDRLEQLGYLE